MRVEGDEFKATECGFGVRQLCQPWIFLDVPEDASVLHFLRDTECVTEQLVQLFPRHMFRVEQLADPGHARLAETQAKEPIFLEECRPSGRGVGTRVNAAHPPLSIARPREFHVALVVVVVGKRSSGVGWRAHVGGQLLAMPDIHELGCHQAAVNRLQQILLHAQPFVICSVTPDGGGLTRKNCADGISAIIG